MMGGAGHWSTWRRYIVYGLHLHSRNYVSALLAVFPKYRALKFTRVYISHYLEIFTRAMSNLHIRHTYLYMYIRNTRTLKLNIINSARDIRNIYKTRCFCHIAPERNLEMHYASYYNWLIIWFLGIRQNMGIRKKTKNEEFAPSYFLRRLHVTEWPIKTVKFKIDKRE